MAYIEGSHPKTFVDLDDTIVGGKMGDYRHPALVGRRSSRLHCHGIEVDWPC